MRKLLAASLALISFSANAVQYQVQQLPFLSSIGHAVAYGQNESGMIVGQAFNSSTGKIEAVAWNNGVIQTLGFEGIARAVNNSGTVVGETGNALLQNPNGRAFSWDSTNGYSDLGDLGGPYAGAYDVSETGVITGFSGSDYVTTPPNVHRNHAFRYENGVMTDMGTNTADGYSRGHGINEAGIIAGRGSLGAFGTSNKYMSVWDAANNMTTVTTAGYGYSTAQQINLGGTMVGNGINSSGDWVGMVWDSSFSLLNELGTFGGAESRAWSINDDGIIVGFADIEGSLNYRRAMISFDDGATIVDLNTLVDDLTGWQYLLNAYDINENGQIVGIGITDSGAQAAFVLTVVPVPAAVWLFGSALGAFFGFSRLRGQRLQKV